MHAPRRVHVRMAAAAGGMADGAVPAGDVDPADAVAAEQPVAAQQQQEKPATPVKLSDSLVRMPS
jgi:hypothetical protein